MEFDREVVEMTRYLAPRKDGTRRWKGLLWYYGAPTERRSKLRNVIRGYMKKVSQFGCRSQKN